MAENWSTLGAWLRLRLRLGPLVLVAAFFGVAGCGGHGAMITTKAAAGSVSGVVTRPLPISGLVQQIDDALDAGRAGGDPNATESCLVAGSDGVAIGMSGPGAAALCGGWLTESFAGSTWSVPGGPVTTNPGTGTSAAVKPVCELVSTVGADGVVISRTIQSAVDAERACIAFKTYGTWTNMSVDSSTNGDTATSSANTMTTATTENAAPVTASGGPCDGHLCIGDWSKEAAEGGTVVQCVDGTWSHAGGISGACSDHGGVGSSPDTGSDNGATAPTTVPSVPTETAPVPSPGGMRSCDQNISADADTSCGFASNTFYEYWRATGGDPEAGEQSVEVWSPATQQSYVQICTNDGSEVDCTHNNGDEVQFSSASVMAYTASQAKAYAASADVGP